MGDLLDRDVQIDMRRDGPKMMKAFLIDGVLRSLERDVSQCALTYEGDALAGTARFDTLSSVTSSPSKSSSSSTSSVTLTLPVLTLVGAHPSVGEGRQQVYHVSTAPSFSQRYTVQPAPPSQRSFSRGSDRTRW